MQLKLSNVRLSFPHVFKRAVFNGEETKYSATFLLDKEGHAELIKKIKAAITTVIREDLKGAKLASDRVCLKDGDDAEYEGYAGCMSFKASNKNRPLVLNRDKSPVAEDDGVIYAGCYVNAVVELWPQNNAQFGKRVNANLLGIQFCGDGTPFGEGGKTASVDDFDEVPFTDGDDISWM